MYAGGDQRPATLRREDCSETIGRILFYSPSPLLPSLRALGLLAVQRPFVEIVSLEYML